MAERKTREERAAERQAARDDREQEKFFTMLDKLPDTQYGAFAKNFATNPEAALDQLSKRVRGVTLEEATAYTQNYVQGNLRQNRRLDRLEDAAGKLNVKDFMGALQACNQGRLSEDACEVVHGLAADIGNEAAKGKGR